MPVVFLGSSLFYFVYSAYNNGFSDPSSIYLRQINTYNLLNLSKNWHMTVRCVFPQCAISQARQGCGNAIIVGCEPILFAAGHTFACALSFFSQRRRRAKRPNSFRNKTPAKVASECLRVPRYMCFAFGFPSFQ